VINEECITAQGLESAGVGEGISTFACFVLALEKRVGRKSADYL